MAICMPPISGSTTSPIPVCTSRSMPATGSVAEQQLVQFGGDPFGADPRQLRGHLLDRGPHPRRDGEAELRDEPRGAQHPQRVVAEGHLRRRRGVEHPGAQRRQTAERVEEFAAARPA